MIPSMTAPVILAGTIRLFLATMPVTARTRLGSRSAMTAQAIKSAWRPARSVSVAATWTQASAHLRDTSSAWSFFSHHTRLAATRVRATRPKLPTGTSMATPHIAGSVALLWSARPELRPDLDATEGTLNSAAVHINSSECGSGSPNNVYGWGRVDVFAAVNTNGTPTPTPTPTP